VIAEVMPSVRAASTTVETALAAPDALIEIMMTANR